MLKGPECSRFEGWTVMNTLTQRPGHLLYGLQAWNVNSRWLSLCTETAAARKDASKRSTCLSEILLTAWSHTLNTRTQSNPHILYRNAKNARMQTFQRLYGQKVHAFISMCASLQAHTQAIIKMPVSPPAVIFFWADFQREQSSGVSEKALITAGSCGAKVSSTFTSHSQGTQQGEPACLAAPACSWLHVWESVCANGYFSFLISCLLSHSSV